MISTTKRVVPPVATTPAPKTPSKTTAPQTETGTPRFKEPKKGEAKKEAPKKALKPSEQKNPKLNVAELINLIKTGKTVTAMTTLKEYKCTSPEGCDFVIFHDGLCFNHYHVKMKYGRTERVNTKHTGEMCAVCHKRPATNRDKCLPCYARIKYHADKAKGIVKGKKVAPKKIPAPAKKPPVSSQVTKSKMAAVSSLLKNKAKIKKGK